VIPERRRTYILRRYERIRPSLPQEKGEVKGRLLSERQVDEVVSILLNKSVIFEVAAIDMGLHSVEGIQEHQRNQASGITANLTTDHHPTVHRESAKLRKQLESLSPQLYVQSVLTFELIATVLKHATLYYVQRMPRELESFHWVIDAKDPLGVTPWEAWWSFVVMPTLQSKFLREPIIHLVGADYSHFDRKFRTELSEFHKSLAPDRKSDEGSDLKKIMSESFRFSSKPERELELVDILTNAVRRGMMGNLQSEGWKNIRSLMIHRNQHYIRLLALTGHATSFDVDVPYMSVLTHFRTGGKNMVRD
jgi:hypothetical protein